MKKALYATAGSALALVLFAAAMPASADVNVTATVTKTKDVRVIERITVHGTVTIAVSALIVPKGAAEASAVMNVTNSGNTVDGQGTNIPHPENEPYDDYNIHLSAVMNGSANGNTGVWGFNQDVGNMVNQGNLVSVAGVVGNGQGLLPTFADAQAEVDQANTNNTQTDSEALRDKNGGVIILTTDNVLNYARSDFLANKEALIRNSINENTGVINVNQNTGSMNSQSNAVAAAVGMDTQVAMSETALGQTNSGNSSTELQTVKHGLIGGTLGSINGNSGIVNVNQSNGNMNNQGNVVSLAAITSGAIISP